ncbi:MAG: methionyl-tRNA formyltransferase [Burkholderia sp.]|nr:MAG: Methionyl-tRNA formyltransferase [Burkholderia gladioli]
MSHSLRIIFAGTPEFAAVALAGIHQAGLPVPLVLTQPDRRAGRGMKLQASAVKQYALTHGLPVAQPPSLRRNGKFPVEACAALDTLNATPHDVMVVAAYGLLLPQEVLDIPRHGCINIHASLLPRWRGGAPIHRSIEAGDTETGVTLMQMDAGLDTGAIISETRVAIAGDDTTASLHDKLATHGAQLIVEALVKLEREGSFAATPQPTEGITYAEKIGKCEAALDWREPAEVLARRIRAFAQFPGGSGTLDGSVLKLWAAEAVAGLGEAEPGTIVEAGAEGVLVACGSGMLRVTQLQKPGGKRLSAREFLAGTPLSTGQRFTLPEPS